VQGVSVIGRTASHPGIAFVADAGLPEPVIGKLRAAILAFREEPSWPELQSLLGVSDITVLDPARYAPMASVAA
jgi:ABC-type phosphate/phosphonate transport system substrate-binding protein